MIFQRKALAGAIVCAASAAIAAQAWGQQQPSDQPATKIEKVVVTGSNIKRIEGETASPVQVISRAEIERAGVATVNDVLQRVTGAGAAIDDRITNGFAPGGGSLNLRGLGFNSTLVLINGRRMPTYPFAQQVGTPQGFNDINNIPLAAVDRIEILKDGASAIYGADAVAGVVNVILRQDYVGTEVTAGLGQSSRGDGNMVNAALSAGFGTLAKDRFNVLVGANYSTRDAIKSIDRPWSRTEDLRAHGGTDRRSAYGYPGTIIDLETGDFYVNAGGTCGPSSQIGGGNSVGRGGYCRYDRSAFGEVQGESDKMGAYLRGTLAISSEITGFAELLFTRNKFRGAGWPAGSTDDVGIGSNIIPAGQTGNPFPHDAQVLYRFSDVGYRGDDGTSDTSRFLLGVKGTTAGWDWEAAANINRIKIDTFAINNALNSRTLCLTNPDAAAIYAAGGDPLGYGTLAQIFAANPAYAAYFQRELAKCPQAFAQYGYYNYANPSANNPGVAAYLKHDSLRQGRSDLDGFDLKASRELMQLAGGPMALAFGFETRKEKVSDVPDEQLQTGDTLAISAAQAFGDRRISAGYAELNMPLTKALEANVAVRYDRYTGNGSFASTSPKVGIRFQPTQQWLIRGTASNAFRAPSLFETSPAQQTAFTFGIQDPVLCPVFDDNNANCALDVRRVQQGNPLLKAEKSTAYTLGVVFEPTRDISIGLDGWLIDRKDEIGSFGDQLLVNLFPNDPNIVVRGANGQIVQINQVPVQLNKTKTHGIDLDFTMRNSLGSAGSLLTKLGIGYVGSYKFSTLDDSGQPVVQEYNGTYNQPRYRATWDFVWTFGPWETALGGYGVGPYEGLGLNKEVGAFQVWQLGVTYSGIKNLKVRFGINNLFDKGPAYNDETSGANAGYNAQWGDPVGRFYTVSASYKFK